MDSPLVSHDTSLCQCEIRKPDSPGGRGGRIWKGCANTHLEIGQKDKTLQVIKNKLVFAKLLRFKLLARICRLTDTDLGRA